MSISELQVQTALKEAIDPNMQEGFHQREDRAQYQDRWNNVTLDVVLPTQRKAFLPRSSNRSKPILKRSLRGAM